MSGNKDNGFYRRIVLGLLKPMDQGHLEIRLPSGELNHFGNERSNKDHAARMTVQNEALFKKCVLYGDIGFGESYVDGDWDTESITDVISWMILNVEKHPTLMGTKAKQQALNFFRAFNNFQHRLNSNSVVRSRRNIRAHYDLGNDFFKLILDPGMVYSSAYFTQSGQGLELAQLEKFRVLCDKLRLSASDHVLELGGGWGGFAVYAAKRFGCRVTTITISEEQFKYCKERFHREGVAEKAEALLTDYRHVTGKFDKIVSIEMIEAVGHEHLNDYFRAIHKHLKADGILALQMIVSPDHRYESFRKNADWIQKHIFPGGLLPAFDAVQRAIRKTGDLGILDYEDMTPHYVKTLSIWRENLNRNREKVLALGFDDKFMRKWNYYFSYCEAAFKMRNIGVAQAIYTRPNNHEL